MGLKGLNLQNAAAFSENISKFFNGRLPPPHDLEFEKIYMPYLLYKKKLYSGLKYEGDYSLTAKGKVHSRGLSVVRRDNALIIKETMMEALKLVTMPGVTRDQMVEFAASRIHACMCAAQEVHTSQLFEQFVCSAGISKALDQYDSPVAAVRIAEQMKEENDTLDIKGGTRVTFVVASALKGTKRADQALLLETLKRERRPLSCEFYTEALMKKLAPLMSVFFAQERQMVRDIMGKMVEVKPKTRAEEALLPGQKRAQEAIERALFCIRTKRKTVEEPRETKPMALLAPRLCAPGAAPKRAKTATGTAKDSMIAKMWKK